MSDLTIATAPYDPRFSSTTDQSKQCWTLYNEYLKCSKKLGVGSDKCKQIFRWANSVCPSDLVQSYYEQRRDDKWYGFDFPMQEEELKEGDEITHRERHDHHGHH